MGINKKMVWGLYIFVGFGFSNAILLTSLLIDIPYMICLLGLTFLTAKVLLIKGTAHSLTWQFSYITVAIGVALFRQNGMIIVCILCCILPILIRPRRRMLINSFLIFCMLFLVKGPLYNYYGVSSCPGLKYLALANDITSTYYAGEDVSVEVEEMAEAINEDNTQEYNPCYAIPNEKSLRNYSITEFIGIYVQNFFSHPQTVFSAFMKRNSVCWSIFQPKFEPQRSTNRLDEVHLNQKIGNYPYRKNNKLTAVLSDISKKITDFPLANIFYWRTAIYLLVLLYFIFALFLTAKKQIKYYIPFIPMILNILTLYLASGWSNYRYCWPTFIISMFLIPYTFIAIRKIKEENLKRKDEKDDNKKIS